LLKAEMPIDHSQAAGMAQSWRSNRREAWTDYAERVAYDESLPTEERAKRKVPAWQVPVLKAVCLQANANVVRQVKDEAAALKLEAAPRGVHDFWLRVSTLAKGQPI
jgi:hypothetical protein